MVGPLTEKGGFLSDLFILSPHVPFPFVCGSISEGFTIGHLEKEVSFNLKVEFGRMNTVLGAYLSSEWFSGELTLTSWLPSCTWAEKAYPSPRHFPELNAQKKQELGARSQGLVKVRGPEGEGPE